MDPTTTSNNADAEWKRGSPIEPSNSLRVNSDSACRIGENTSPSREIPWAGDYRTHREVRDFCLTYFEDVVREVQVSLRQSQVDRPPTLWEIRNRFCRATLLLSKGRIKELLKKTNISRQSRGLEPIVVATKKEVVSAPLIRECYGQLIHSNGQRPTLSELTSKLSTTLAESLGASLRETVVASAVNAINRVSGADDKLILSCDSAKAPERKESQSVYTREDSECDVARLPPVPSEEVPVAPDAIRNAQTPKEELEERESLKGSYNVEKHESYAPDALPAVTRKREKERPPPARPMTAPQNDPRASPKNTSHGKTEPAVKESSPRQKPTFSASDLRELVLRCHLEGGGQLSLENIQRFVSDELRVKVSQQAIQALLRDFKEESGDSTPEGSRPRHTVDPTIILRYIAHYRDSLYLSARRGEFPSKTAIEKKIGKKVPIDLVHQRASRSLMKRGGPPIFLRGERHVHSIKLLAEYKRAVELPDIKANTVVPTMGEALKLTREDIRRKLNQVVHFTSGIGLPAFFTPTDQPGASLVTSLVDLKSLKARINVAQLVLFCSRSSTPEQMRQVAETASRPEKMAFFRGVAWQLWSRGSDNPFEGRLIALAFAAVHGLVSCKYYGNTAKVLRSGDPTLLQPLPEELDSLIAETLAKSRVERIVQDPGALKEMLDG